MKRLSRRQFVGTTSRFLGASMLGGMMGACARPEDAEMAAEPAAQGARWRYAICNEIMQDWEWQRQCEYSAEVGYTGLEVAPFTLSEHVDELSPARRDELRSTAEAAGLEILGLHWLLVTPRDLHSTTPDADLRSRTWDYMAKLGDLCADLGGKVMIFGSPNQRNTIGISREEAMANYAEGCRQVADHLAEREVTLLIEPLSSDQTDVINTLDEAVSIVRDVNHPAISAMFDFHNTADETQPLDELVRQHYDHIEHIQIQEMDGTYMGTGDAVETFVPAMRAFRDLGYDRWVSLEVFDFEPGPEMIASVSMETLKAIEAKL